MSPLSSAALVNFVGFLTGGTLYAMLLILVVRQPRFRGPVPHSGPATLVSPDLLPLSTALLGLFWNLGSLAVHALHDFMNGQPPAILIAGTYVSLGFLPAVVVHSSLRSQPAAVATSFQRWVSVSAYGLSTVAGLIHLGSGIQGKSLPAQPALLLLTAGFGVIMAALFWATRDQSGDRRAVWAVALAVFAVSALHLGQADHETESWWLALLGHQASIPLAFAILYEDFRFALADIFLKRALILLTCVGLVLGVSGLGIAPLFVDHGRLDLQSPLTLGVLLSLWVGSILCYPLVTRIGTWFVDSIVLRRPDYQAFCGDLARTLTTVQDPQLLLDRVSHELQRALTAQNVSWVTSDVSSLDQDSTAGQPHRQLAEFPIIWHNHHAKGNFSLAEETGLVTHVVFRKPQNRDRPRLPLMPFPKGQAAVLIPTVEPPNFLIVISDLSGGRRLLSDDIAMLETVAVMVARRIDALKVNHERCEQNLRTQELSKLATEAELRTLRAQINPHFLFNALTTIGYLIQTSPERALETLLRLTSLLRTVLKSSGEFSTLGDELDLIESYLVIERARFEERLRITVMVPDKLRQVRIPALIIQPIVENAVKHGIAQSKTGGEVCIAAETDSEGGSGLRITITDTGVGVSEFVLAQNRRRGLGLANVERRLSGLYGQQAGLTFESTPGRGTTVVLTIPTTQSDERSHSEFRSAKGKSA
ncbi:MAG TPA: histidine kinase [Acidobacteriota bacterium]|nr:histidine kinase [Acidobacteriota bacterium]